MSIFCEPVKIWDLLDVVFCCYSALFKTSVLNDVNVFISVCMFSDKIIQIYTHLFCEHIYLQVFRLCLLILKKGDKIVTVLSFFLSMIRDTRKPPLLLTMVMTGVSDCVLFHSILYY